LASRLAVARTSRRIRPLFPRQPGVLRAHPGQQMRPMASPSRTTTRVSLPHLASLGADTQPPRSTDERERRLRPGQLTSSADDRPGSVNEPWAKTLPPSCFGIADAAADHLRRPIRAPGTTRRSSSPVARERLAVLRNAHQVPRALADAGCRQHVHDGL